MWVGGERVHFVAADLIKSVGPGRVFDVLVCLDYRKDNSITYYML